MAQCVRITIFVFLLISIYDVNGGANTALSVTVNIIKLAKTLWEIYKNDGASKNVMEQLKFFSLKSDMLKLDIGTMEDKVISEITTSVPGLVELNRRLSKVFVNSLRIKKSFDDFMHYIEEPEKYDPNILKEFALKAISEDSSGLDNLLEEIHGLVIRDEITSPSAIRLLNKHMEFFLRYINALKSPQQLFHNFFDSIVYTEIKGHLTILYSFQLLKMYQQGDFKGHIQKSEKDFTRRINSTVNAFKTTIGVASREFWKSDPVEHIKDATYTELKRVFQEYIINEYDISTSDDCYHKCSDYRTPSKRSRGETYPSRCHYEDEICSVQRVCTGYSYECRRQINSTMHICPSAFRSDRRYQYIEFGDTNRYGLEKEKCPTKIIKADHHTDVIYHIFNRCDSCMCICDDEEDENSERFFNLEPSISRIEENYVVTGARFVKRNRIIHIQIQEGKLLRNGRIDKHSIVWVPFNENPKRLHKLIWDKSRGINLNDLNAPKDHVLIGLSFFSKIYDSKYERLHLKIVTSPMYFTSGIVESNNRHFLELISESSTDEIDLNDLDVPTRMPVQLFTRSRSGQYLKFGPSGLQNDVGQSTIPFIDIQELTTDPPMPMSGAGIYHKSRKGSGGFIALKLFTYNIAPYLEANLPALEYIPPKTKFIKSEIARLEWIPSSREPFINNIPPKTKFTKSEIARLEWIPSSREPLGPASSGKAHFNNIILMNLLITISFSNVYLRLSTSKS